MASVKKAVDWKQDVTRLFKKIFDNMEYFIGLYVYAKKNTLPQYNIDTNYKLPWLLSTEEIE